MDYSASSSDLRQTYQLNKNLLKTRGLSTPATFGPWALEPSVFSSTNMERAMSTPTVGVEVQARAIRVVQSTNEPDQPPFSRDELTTPLLPGSEYQDYASDTHSTQPESAKALVCNIQPCTKELQDIKAVSVPEDLKDRFKPDTILTLLEQIKNRDGCWGKISVFCALRTHNHRNNDPRFRTNDYIDSEWITHLQPYLEAIERNLNRPYPHRDEVTLAIQLLTFTTIQFKSHYYSKDSDASNDALSNLENEINHIIRYFYLQFDNTWIEELITIKNYSKSPLHFNFSPQINSWNLTIVEKKLCSHFSPTASKYLPGYLMVLKHTELTETNLDEIFDVSEKEKEEAKERKRLRDLYTYHDLKKSLIPAEHMYGYPNFRRTCFVSATLAGFMPFYFPRLRIQRDDLKVRLEELGYKPVKVNPVKDEQSTSLDLDIGSFLKAEGKRLQDEKNKMQEQFENILTHSDIPVNEEAIQELQDEASKVESSLDCLLSMVLQHCLLSINDELSEKDHIDEIPDKEHIKFQKTCKTMIQVLIEASKLHLFSGIETIAKVSEPSHLRSQDCAEFLLPFLDVLAESCLPQELLYHEMIEKCVTKEGKKITIVTYDEVISNVSTDVRPAESRIYMPAISLEQSLKAGFSLQMILDGHMSPTNSGDQQIITVEPKHFLYATDKQSSCVEIAVDIELNKESRKNWLVENQRTVLVASNPPELVTVQLRFPGDFYQRASIADRLLKDDSTKVSLTFRNKDTLIDERHEYEKVCTVFHAEESDELDRHYRASIKRADGKWMLFDDHKVYHIPEENDINLECGAPSLYILKKVAIPSDQLIPCG